MQVMMAAMANLESLEKLVIQDIMVTVVTRVLLVSVERMASRDLVEYQEDVDPLATQESQEILERMVPLVTKVTLDL